MSLRTVTPQTEHGYCRRKQLDIVLTDFGLCVLQAIRRGYDSMVYTVHEKSRTEGVRHQTRDPAVIALCHSEGKYTE